LPGSLKKQKKAGKEATFAKQISMPRHHGKFVWKATFAKYNSMPRHHKKFVCKAT
jgi:hypothetical protein